MASATSSSSPRLSLRCRGPMAVFSRPEMKVERMSYPVMTPSAARGILESVLWKPAIRWIVDEICVLRPIEYTSFRRNEVNSKAVAPAAAVIRSGGAAPMYFADEDRAQRNTVALRDVDYVVHAHFEMTDRAGEQDNLNKFVEMFRRRIDKGQHFQQPYFGCREFIADVLPADNAPSPIDEDRELGIMLWDIEFGKWNVPVYFAARLRAGVLKVPATSEEARATAVQIV